MINSNKWFNHQEQKKALKVSTFWQNDLSSFVIGVQIYLPTQCKNSIDNQ